MAPTTEPEPLVCAVGDLVEDVVVRAERRWHPRRRRPGAPSNGIGAGARRTRPRSSSRARRPGPVRRPGRRRRHRRPPARRARCVGCRVRRAARGAHRHGRRRRRTRRRTHDVQRSGRGRASSRTRRRARGSTARAVVHVPVLRDRRRAATVARAGLLVAARDRGMIVSMDPSTSVLADGRFGAARARDRTRRRVLQRRRGEGDGHGRRRAARRAPRGREAGRATGAVARRGADGGRRCRRSRGAIDTTGAGDAFAGGFLLALARAAPTRSTRCAAGTRPRRRASCAGSAPTAG